MKNYLLNVDEKGVNHTLASFLGRLITDGMVGALLVPQDAGSGKSVSMALIKSPDALKNINPFAPVSLVNSARIVSEMTSQGVPDEKIGVLMRSCETRAMLELAKHNQVDLENIVVIGMDCLGTLEPADYSQVKDSGANLTDDWMAASAGGETREELNGKPVRRACLACGHIEAEHADIHLGWVGIDSKLILVSVSEEYEGWASAFLNPAGGQETEGRQRVMEAVRSRREENKKKLYQEFAGRTGSVQSLLEELSGCLKCHNCRQACPLCFCRECVFSTDIFKHDPEYFLSRAGRKGLIGMPSGKLLFHLTRINHMAVGCVGCGQCESACPAKIPLGIIFKMAGERLQEVFDYVPGRSLEEEPPLTTYKETELEPR